MIQANGYFTFDGNCREAMLFYQQCLGGELQLETIGDSPMADRLPDKMRNCILHATLTCNNMVLMGSDMVSENGLVRGNAVSLVLNCSSEAEIEQLYKDLSDGGKATHPLEISFWGATFGALTDRYSNHWLLHYMAATPKG